MTIFADGTLRTDDLQLYDSAGAPPLPAAGAVTRSTADTSGEPPAGPVEVFRPTESTVSG